MIDFLIHPDPDGKFTLIMPLNPDEGFGRMETVIPFDETTIPQPFQNAIVAELAKPEDERGPGFPGQSWRGLTPAGIAEAATVRMKQRRGQNQPALRFVYFYDSVDDKAIEQGNPITFSDDRMLKTVGTGDDEHQVPADPIDDGRYYGPTTAPDALGRVS